MDIITEMLRLSEELHITQMKIAEYIEKAKVVHPEYPEVVKENWKDLPRPRLRVSTEDKVAFLKDNLVAYKFALEGKNSAVVLFAERARERFGYSEKTVNQDIITMFRKTYEENIEEN